MSRNGPQTHDYPPHRLFLLFALPVGLLIVFITPPLAGPDEIYHFQRSVSIAYGHLLNDELQAPSGIAEFMNMAKQDELAYLKMEPHRYRWEQYRTLAALPLVNGPPQALEPTIFTIHHPFSYVPQAFAVRLALLFNMRPLVLIYTARLAGLAVAIYLTYLAIRIIPAYRYALCALALLPTVLFYRSVLNADVVTNGLAFLFIACVMREMRCDGPIAIGRLLGLGLQAFIFMQCKSAYIPLALFVLAIPRARFAGKGAHVLALFGILLPGLAASIGWMLLMKYSFFAGRQYETWGGIVSPDAQIALIIKHPLWFVGVLARSVFSMDFVTKNFQECIGNIGLGFSIPIRMCLSLAAMLVAVLFAEPERPGLPGKWVCILIAGIFITFLTLSLTLLYAQWTGVGQTQVQGFQGRYFYPVLPLLFLFLPPRSQKYRIMNPVVWTALIAATSAVFTLSIVTAEYFKG